MKHASLALGSFLALAVAACSSAPPPRPSSPIPSATEAAMAPTGTPMVDASATMPVSDDGQTVEEPRPTITVNPHLHATNPQNVKLASGDQPTLVEFFAFW